MIIAPFNFPLEIPALQLVGALAMGNRPLVKPETKVSVVLEQFVRLLIHCGLDPNDLDVIHCKGTAMGELIESSRDDIRLVQFTGSSGVAEHLSGVMNGAVRIEDAGFDGVYDAQAVRQSLFRIDQIGPWAEAMWTALGSTTCLLAAAGLGPDPACSPDAD